MPRPTNPVPTYRLHKQSGQAIVTINANGTRKDVLLGKFDSPESKAEYERILHTLRTPGGVSALASPVPLTGQPDTTVAEVLLAFWTHAERHYRDANDNPTSELGNYRIAFKPVRTLYAHTPAREFGPRALKACRQWMIDAKWCRKQINSHVARIKWAASEELIPATVFQALTTVAGLQTGRTEAHDCDPVPPAPDEVVDATLPHLNRHVRGPVEFQRLTGCRPGEVCKLRCCDIDTTSDVWVYRPPQHKIDTRA